MKKKSFIFCTLVNFHDSQRTTDQNLWNDFIATENVVLLDRFEAFLWIRRTAHEYTQGARIMVKREGRLV